MDKPPCFDSEQQFVQWVQLASTARTNGKSAMIGYCRDCTPEYAERMRREKRCIQPQVVFAEEEDGEVVGRGYRSDAREEMTACLQGINRVANAKVTTEAA